MDQILDLPSPSDRGLNYAGFWIRVGAALIDTVILWVVNVILAFSFLGGFDVMASSISFNIVSLVMGLMYQCAFESSSLQATPGKIAVGIKVGHSNGERISFGTALARYFLKFLSFIILCIGFMMVGWDPKKQGLHDKLANTYVYYP
ncbi:MAG TPA: RDD family protein [Ohtaekwangia sp.]|nr:RDD family protein [Ohtaekwangia sp.]